MPELLLELLSEEIPARMQARAAEDLKRLVCQGLKDAGLKFDRAQAFATPRRLTLVVDGLPKKQPEQKIERKGPRVGAPDNAIKGFLKSAGLDSVDKCEIRDVKGEQVYFLVSEKTVLKTTNVLKDILGSTLNRFPWPKSMKWAENDLLWVRPLQNVLAIFDGRKIPFSIGLKSHNGKRVWGEGEENLYDFECPLTANNKTVGHRFLAPKKFTVTGFVDYKKKLKAAKVILDPAERRAVIEKQAKRKAARAKLVLKDDPALLDEVTGLVEWPVVLMGRIDPEFMDLPPEVLTISMRAHQKYLALVDQSGALANRFLVVANMATADNGKAIAAGNERVLRARLADARFFWDQDRKAPLSARTPRLGQIVFHAKLGSLDQKIDRVQALAAEIAGHIEGADKDRVRSAARLCKADLTTGMVGEFPELQGVMGRYYALADGEHAEAADAIAEHYAPQGPNDACPSAPVSVALALADKIDTLVGFWAIDEKPTGSKDPYALRRAALGVIRLILENDLRLPLSSILHRAFFLYLDQTDLQIASELLDLIYEDNFPVKVFHDVKFTGISYIILDKDELFTSFIDYHISNHREYVDRTFQEYAEVERRIEMFCVYLEKFQSLNQEILHSVFARTDPDWQDQKELRKKIVDAKKELELRHATPVSKDILHFFADRLKVALRESGVRHDLISAVFAVGGEDDLVRLLARVAALDAFLKTEDGANLLVAYQRAANIVRIEEKHDKLSYQGADLAIDQLVEEAECALGLRVLDSEAEAEKALAAEDFTAAMAALAKLRQPVDDFFDRVTVNTENPELRANRLRLLGRIRATLDQVADFSKIEG